MYRSGAKADGLMVEKRISHLAQELQDLILDFTLMAGIVDLRPGRVVGVFPGYKPPWQLSVNSRSRSVVAAWYYRTQVFYVTWAHEYKLFSDLGPWLESLSTKQQREITSIRVKVADNYRQPLTVSTFNSSSLKQLWLSHHITEAVFVDALIVKLVKEVIGEKKLLIREEAFSMEMEALHDGDRVEKVWVNSHESIVELQRFDALQALRNEST